MKKVIIINEKKNLRLTSFIDWLVHMLGYAVILISMSVIFPKTIIIDNSYFGLYAFLAAIIIYFLNKTIKPILFWLTLPITGLTLGLFYPFLNVIVLKIVSFILGNNFMVGSLFMTFFVAILISIMNILMKNIVIDPIIRSRDNG